MTAASQIGDESDAVLAFIREQQGTVLHDAIDKLATCDTTELPAVVHAIHGALGSYQLTEAAAEVGDLAVLLADPSTPAPTVEEARLATVTALRSVAEALPPGGSG